MWTGPRRVLSPIAAIALAVMVVGPAAAAYIEGTDGKDNIYGTVDPDRIRGLGGDDFLVGSGQG